MNRGVFARSTISSSRAGGDTSPPQPALIGVLTAISDERVPRISGAKRFRLDGLMN
jgi:hypothetical protein